MKEKFSENERFFSKVSHDLRGSFTSILGFSDILNDPTENLTDNEVSEFAERIGKQSRDSFDLLVNFINWLKLETYDYGLTNEKIGLFDILNEIKILHQKELKSKNVKMNIEIEETDFVIMDHEIILSILNNIFLFLIKSCSENSQLMVNRVSNKLGDLTLELSANYSNKEASFLQNIDLRDLNNELSFPIIFAIKFIERSGGKFNFSFDRGNNLLITLKIPNKKKKLL